MPKATKDAPKRPPKKPSAGGRADRETEQRILEAARAVFIRRGTAGARMQEIAAEAGVNQALLHYYFRSKERLSNAVFQQMASRLFPALIQTLGADTSIDEKIGMVIGLYLDNLSRNPFLPGYVLSELHHHPQRLPQMLAAATGSEAGRALSRVFGKLGDQIEHEVRARRMRPISVEQFVANLISLCVFPFAARPMLSMVFGMDAAAFAEFIDRRRTDLPDFFRNALRP
jgi:TetR/AcrR family transcriptional regulator